MTTTEMTPTATETITASTPPEAAATFVLGDLRTALTTLEIGVSKDLPALGLIRVTVDGTGGARLRCFDVQTSVTALLPVSEEVTGEILIPHRRLKAALTAATKGVRPKARDQLNATLTFEGETGAVLVNGYTVPLTDGNLGDLDSLPTVPVTPEPAASLPVGRLRTMLASAVVATETSGMVPVLNCVRLDFDKDANTLTAVGTDRYRYVRAVTSAPVARDVGGANLPASLVKAILRDLKSAPENQMADVGLDRSDSGDLWFTLTLQEGARWSARLDENNFPNLSGFTGDQPLTCNRAELVAAITRAAGLADLEKTGSSGARVILDVAPNRLTVTPGLDPDSTPVSAPPIDARVDPAGDGLCASFTGAYLIDATRGSTADDITFSLGRGRRTPAVFTDEVDGVDLTHYVMPCHMPAS